MHPQQVKLTYQEKPITLEVNGDVMVNATEMAKCFNKEVKNYIRLDTTKEFVIALCRSSHLSYENEFSPLGKYVVVKQGGNNQGTWMHRIVALDFAAWLDPFFRVWAWQQIDQLFFDRFNKREGYYEKRGKLFDELREIEAAIKQIKSHIAASEQGKQLAQLEAQRKQVIAALGKTDQDVFGKQLTIEIE